MESSIFFYRDVSWLSFNDRILDEAQRETVPLMERIRFLSIYSSNLDEFYRVRMPALLALQKISNQKAMLVPDEALSHVLAAAREMIQQQLNRFGLILTSGILPLLQKNNVELIYNQPLPKEVQTAVTAYFFNRVLAFLQLVELTAQSPFFPENSSLYFAVLLQPEAEGEKIYLLNIPSDKLPRFFSVIAGGKQYIVFLDDIIRWNLDFFFTGMAVKGCYSFKITRNAEIDFNDDYAGDLAAQIEQQLRTRDEGLATRFLYEPGLPLRMLHVISEAFDLQAGSLVQGGRYHNLKDLGTLPLKNKEWSYPAWPPTGNEAVQQQASLLSLITKKDLIVHTPYQSYDTILRFYNEAATAPAVEEIYATLYRVASDSQIVEALISAAKNGKKVQVLVELKARFDEANNIKWAKKMKAAGVKIIYSITSLKVHAKMALVKMRRGERLKYAGMLATGNFNETTARFYTDHILLTTHAGMMQEMELLFLFLAKREKPSVPGSIPFQHLLVSQFNLQQTFIALIDAEIENARKGLPAYIHIKMNNLEEKVLITKLYEASGAGVKIALIVRSICCLIPGKAGLSENISVRRIVDRFLEHERTFIFGNGGDPKLYLGSADWMNRNIYHRIEVCFPVHDADIKKEILELIAIQLQDNVQAVLIDEHLESRQPEMINPVIRSQEEIYRFLQAGAAITNSIL